MPQKKKKIYVLDTSVILFSHDSIMNFEENDIGIPISFSSKFIIESCENKITEVSKT